jgi:hypothetical protein
VTAGKLLSVRLSLRFVSEQWLWRCLKNENHSDEENSASLKTSGVENAA